MKYSHINLIESISVEGLFGFVTYDLNISGLSGADKPITLFYGENGSGKTTLLKLIFGSLSSKTWGIRRQICEIKFKKFRITTSYGLSVQIEKNSIDDKKYKYLLYKNGVEIEYSVDLDDKDRLIVDGPGGLRGINKNLESFGVDCVFINDRRRIRSTKAAFVFKDPRQENTVVFHGWQERSIRSDTAEDDVDIVRIAQAVTEEFRREVLKEGRTGQESSDAIYLELARRISSYEQQGPASKSLDILLSNLNELEDNSSRILKYRAMARPPIDDIRKLIADTSDARRVEVARVLSPYIDAMMARTSALNRSVDKFSLLIDTMNEYFTRKRVRFDLDRGLRVTAPDGSRINLRLLSSGEQHLFVLLSSAFLSRGAKTLFLIDEPELSLNVFWQRKLPVTLSKLADKSNIDFFLSTHSLEILTEFNDRICMIGG